MSRICFDYANTVFHISPHKISSLFPVHTSILIRPSLNLFLSDIAKTIKSYLLKNFQ